MIRVFSRSVITAVGAVALFWAIPFHAQTTPAGEQKTLTGVVSDTMCGKTHMLKGKSDGECIRQCIKMGEGFALMVGGKMYALRGHSADLDKYAGQKVILTGTVRGNAVAVESVAPAN